MGMSCGSVPIVIENKENDIINDYRSKALNKHNELRNKHGSPNLKMNEDLNKMAQEYASKILQLEGKTSFPSNIYNDSTLGENIFISIKANVEEMCQNWYEENKYYNFDMNKFQRGTSHFTQLIWKETKEVGFGFAFSKENKFCGVALYYPAGNILGEFSNNVNKAK